MNFIKDARKNPKNDFYRYNMDKIFDYNVIRNGEEAWIADNGKTKQHVLRIMKKNSVIITVKTEEANGKLSDINIVGKRYIKNADAYMPIKTSIAKMEDVTKYGGYGSISSAGYALVEYKVKGKKVRSLEALPVYLGRSNALTNEDIMQYISAAFQKEYAGKEISDLSVRVPFIPMESKVEIDGCMISIALT